MMMSGERKDRSSTDLRLSSESRSSGSTTTPAGGAVEVFLGEKKEKETERDANSLLYGGLPPSTVKTEELESGDVGGTESTHARLQGRVDEHDGGALQTPTLSLPSPQSGFWISSALLGEPPEEEEPPSREEEVERFLHDFLPAAAHPDPVESSVHPSHMSAVVEGEQGAEEVDEEEEEAKNYPTVVATASLVSLDQTLSASCRTPGTRGELAMIPPNTSASISPSPRDCYHYFSIAQPIPHPEIAGTRGGAGHSRDSSSLITTYTDQIGDEGEGEEEIPPLSTAHGRSPSFPLSASEVATHSESGPHLTYPPPGVPSGFSGARGLSPFDSKEPQPGFSSSDHVFSPENFASSPGCGHQDHLNPGAPPEELQFNQRTSGEGNRMVEASAYAAGAQTSSSCQRQDDDEEEEGRDDGHSSMLRTEALGSLSPPQVSNPTTGAPSLLRKMVASPASLHSLSTPAANADAFTRHCGVPELVDGSANAVKSRDVLESTASTALSTETFFGGRRAGSAVAELLGDSPVSMNLHPARFAEAASSPSSRQKQVELPPQAGRGDSHQDAYGQLLKVGQKLSAVFRHEERERGGSLLPFPVSTVAAITEGFREHLQVLVKEIILAAGRAGRPVCAPGGGWAGNKTSVAGTLPSLSGDECMGKGVQGVCGRRESEEEEEEDRERRGGFVPHDSERSTVVGIDEEQGKEQDTSGEDSGRVRDHNGDDSFFSQKEYEKMPFPSGEAQEGREDRTVLVAVEQSAGLCGWLTSEADQKEVTEVEGVELQTADGSKAGRATDVAVSATPMRKTGHHGEVESCGEPAQQTGEKSEVLDAEVGVAASVVGRDKGLAVPQESSGRRVDERRGTESERMFSPSRRRAEVLGALEGSGREERVKTGSCGDGGPEDERQGGVGLKTEERELSSAERMWEFLTRYEGKESLPQKQGQQRYGTNTAVSSDTTPAAESSDVATGGGGGGDFGEGASRTPYGTEEALRKKDMKIPEVSVLKRHHQSGHHDGGVARSSGFVSTGVCTPKQRTGSIAYDDDSVRQGGARDPADRKSFSECALAKEGFFECRRKRYSGVSVSSCYSTACPSSFSIVDDPPSGCSSVSSSPVFCGMGAMEEETAYHTQVLQNCSLDELADYALVLLPFMSADPPDLALSSYDPSFLHSVLLQLHLLKRRRLDCQHGQAASSSSSSSVNDGRHSSIDFAGACTSSQKSSDDGKDDENDSSEEGTFKGAGGDSSSHTPTSHISRQEEERAILDVLMNAGYEGEPGRSVSDSGLGSQLEAPSLVPPPWLSSSSFVSSGGQPAGRHLPSSHPGQGFHRRSFCLDDGSEGDVAAKPQHQPAGQEGRGGVTIPSSSTKVRSGFFTLGNSSPSSTTPSLLSPPSGVRTPWDDPGTGQITTNASTTSPSSSCSLPSNPGSMVVAGEGERKESTCRRQEKVKHSDSSSQAVPLSPFSLPPATKSRPSSEQEEDQKDLFSEELGGKTGRDNRTESSFPKITLSPSAACTPELRRAGTPSGRHQDGTGEQEEKGMEFGSDTEGSSDEQPRKGDDMLMVVMASPSPPRSACSPSYTPPLSPSLPCAASLSCPSPCALPPPCAPAAAAPGEWSAPLPEQKTEDKEGILGHLPRRSPYLLPSGPSVAQTSGASSTLLGRPPQIHGRPSSSSSQGRADGGSSFDSRSLSSVQPEFLHPLCFTGLASGTKEPEQLDSQRGCGVEEVEVVPFSSSLSPAGHVPGHTEAEAVGKDPPKGVPGACLTTNVQDRRRAGKKRQEWHEAREGLPQVDPAVSNVVGREDLAMERSGEMSRDACAAFRSAQSVEELEEGEVKRGLERTPNGEAVAYFHPQQNTHGLYAGRGVEDPEGVTAGDRATPAVSGTGSDAYGVAIPLAEEEDEEGGFFPTFSSRWGEEGYLHGSPFSSTFSTGFSTSSGQYPVHYATDDTSVSTSVSREFVTGGPASSFASSRSSPAVPVDSTGHGGAPGPLLPPVSTSMPQVPTCVRPSSAGHPGLTSEDAVVFSASQSAYPGPGATESFALAHSRGDNGEDVNFEGGEVVVTPKNGSHCCSGIGVGSPFDEDEISGRRRDSSNKKRSKGKSKAKGIVPIPLVPFVTIGLEGKPGGQYNLATPSAEHVTARRGEQSSGKTVCTRAPSFFRLSRPPGGGFLRGGGSGVAALVWGTQASS